MAKHGVSSCRCCVKRCLSYCLESKTPVPIRSGYLSTFSHTVFHGHAYERCSACSSRVLTAWEAGGDGFLLAALQDPGVLEEAAGLSELHSTVDCMLEVESDGEGREDDWTEL